MDRIPSVRKTAAAAGLLDDHPELSFAQAAVLVDACCAVLDLGVGPVAASFVFHCILEPLDAAGLVEDILGYGPPCEACRVRHPREEPCDRRNGERLSCGCWVEGQPGERAGGPSECNLHGPQVVARCNVPEPFRSGIVGRVPYEPPLLDLSASELLAEHDPGPLPGGRWPDGRF